MAWIRFEVDDELVEELRGVGVDVEALAQEAFESAALRVHREAALERLVAASREPVEPVRRSLRRGRLESLTPSWFQALP